MQYSLYLSGRKTSRANIEAMYDLKGSLVTTRTYSVKLSKERSVRGKVLYVCEYD